jgi:hypothetical protein
MSSPEKAQFPLRLPQWLPEEPVSALWFLEWRLESTSGRAAER